MLEIDKRAISAAPPERVTALGPPRRLAYELVSGIPIRDYRAAEG
jgi:hypothetical protein